VHDSTLTAGGNAERPEESLRGWWLLGEGARAGTGGCGAEGPREEQFDEERGGVQFLQVKNDLLHPGQAGGTFRERRQT